jgi:DNA-binding transcriptional regulator YhcF (GntR family)
MIVRVDPDSPVPIFEQLRDQITRLIVSGQLVPGTRLPAIRHLATDLGLARGTVAKVYETLARDGLVTASGRAGTVVTPTQQHAHAVATSDLTRAAQQVALIARQLGLSPDQAEAAIRKALNA